MLGRVPTDQVIAEVFAEESLSEEWAMLTGDGRRDRRDLGMVVKRLGERIEAEISRGPRQLHSQSVEISIGGYQVRVRRSLQVQYRPLLWRIVVRQGSVETLRRRPRRGALQVAGTPTGVIGASDAKALFGAINWATAAVARDGFVLAGFVQRMAGQITGRVGPIVGKNCLVVTIPAPSEEPFVEVRYVPDPHEPLLVEHGGVLPWIVANGSVVYPSTMTPGRGWTLGGLRVRTFGPPPLETREAVPGRTVVYAHQSLARRRA
jgi:hypothetical protein